MSLKTSFNECHLNCVVYNSKNFKVIKHSTLFLNSRGHAIVVVDETLIERCVYSCFIKVTLMLSFGDLCFFRFRILEIPLQTGKVAIVTGGSGGIGFYVAKGLVKKNVHVIIGLYSIELYT